MTTQLLTLAEAAKAAQFCEWTLRQEIRAGHLVARRLSPRGRIRIHPADLEAWMESKRVVPAS